MFFFFELPTALDTVVSLDCGTGYPIVKYVLGEFYQFLGVALLVSTE